MASPVSFALCAMLAVALSGNSGCHSQSTVKPSQESDQRPRKTAQVGPVTLSIELSTDHVSTAQQATIRITLKASKGVTVHLDDYERTLRDSDYWYDLQLTPRGKKQAVPLDRDTLLWSQDYDVKFLLAQDYELPGASATFVDLRSEENQAQEKDAKEESQKIQTESVLIHVHRPADAVALTDQELRHIETLPPIELPARWSRWWWLGPVIAVGILAGLLFLVYLGSLISPPLARLWRSLKRLAGIDDSASLQPILPAHEWAYREIDQLLAQDLLRKGRVQRFYYRISDIVRGYVERRFALSAPEMTSEEFLEAAATDARFEPNEKEALSDFLSACDLVKYAAYTPQTDQGLEMAKTAKQFVDHTREQEPAVTVEGSSQTRMAASAEVSSL